MADLTRLMLPFDEDAIVVPETGTIAILRAQAGGYPDFPTDRLHCTQGFFPANAALAAQGYTATPDLPDSASLAIMHITRAKDENRALMAATYDILSDGGQLVVDGAKTDGIESLLKAAKKLHPIGGQLSKSHGKVFWLTKSTPANPFSDWSGPLTPSKNPDGFFTAAGIFSTDAIDAGSSELAPHFEKSLKGRVADLGAGWGWLAAQALLSNPDIETLDLIEAEHAALTCARRNVTDPRAAFHWDDATNLPAKRIYDAVITNPPFHTTRQADPNIGRAFIQSAAAILKPTGHLLMVANRQLAYESTLDACFARVEVLHQTGRYKIIRARKPK